MITAKQKSAPGSRGDARTPMAERMEKKTLMSLVARRTRADQALVEQVVEATFETVFEALKRGESVSLRDFGTFYVRPEPGSWVFKDRGRGWIPIPLKRLGGSAPPPFPVGLRLQRITLYADHADRQTETEPHSRPVPGVAPDPTGV